MRDCRVTPKRREKWNRKQGGVYGHLYYSEGIIIYRKINCKFAGVMQNDFKTILK